MSARKNERERDRERSTVHRIGQYVRHLVRRQNVFDFQINLQMWWYLTSICLILAFIHCSFDIDKSDFCGEYKGCRYQGKVYKGPKNFELPSETFF